MAQETKRERTMQADGVDSEWMRARCAVATDRTAVAGYRSGGEEVNISFCGFDACGVLWSTRCARDDIFSRKSVGKRFNKHIRVYLWVSANVP